MNMSFKFIFLFIILSKLDLLYCQNEDFEIIKYQDKKDFILNNSFSEIRLYMEVDEVLSKNMIYLYVYITDPTKITFNYKFEKEKETKDFENLDSYIVVNHGSDHTIYYKIQKPEDKGNKLYIKITANNFKEGQKITVESTESITDIYLILSIVLLFLILISVVIIVLSLLCVYNAKRDKSITETNEDVIIEKVSPEDISS